jgi:penicillin-binding protein A
MRDHNNRRPLWVLAITFFSLIALSTAVAWTIARKQFKIPFRLTQQHLATELSAALDQSGSLPVEIEIPVFQNDEVQQSARIHSTLNEEYGAILRKYLNRYKPDYGAVAVLNADTGAILALESYVRDPEEELGHLALRSPFPAASVFKIVTAAAAIDQGKAYAETVIPFNGRNHTLFRKHVKDNQVTRWTQHVTLREAFGKSINTVFGKLGLFHVGIDDLTRYAENFHFNKELKSDLLIEKSRFMIDPTSSWELVESSAGFTKRTTLSPIHGAMIAAAILKDGEMKSPYVVDRVVSEHGETLFEGRPKALEPVMVSYSARQMQLLMEETVVRGTSRKPFRGLANENEDFLVGGKTGSLTGNTVAGRTDWFVGYAAHDDLRLAVGVVTVHKKFWTVRSSMLARLFFEDVFDKTTYISQKKPARSKLRAKAR